MLAARDSFLTSYRQNSCSLITEEDDNSTVKIIRYLMAKEGGRVAGKRGIIPHSVPLVLFQLFPNGLE